MTEEVREGELAIASGAGIREVSLDERAQAEPLVQLTQQQQPGIGGHRRAPEFHAKVGVEREANRARFRVTYRAVPSAPARNP